MSNEEARRSDPLTSHTAASQVDLKGKRLQVWHALYRMDHGRSGTWDELKVALPNVKPDSISNRLPELVERYYAYRLEVDGMGNIVGFIIGEDVHREKLRCQTRACLFSSGKQIVNYWHAPWLELPDIEGIEKPPMPKSRWDLL